MKQVGENEIAGSMIEKILSRVRAGGAPAARFVLLRDDRRGLSLEFLINMQVVDSDGLGIKLLALRSNSVGERGLIIEAVDWQYQDPISDGEAIVVIVPDSDIGKISACINRALSFGASEHEILVVSDLADCGQADLCANFPNQISSKFYFISMNFLVSGAPLLSEIERENSDRAFMENISQRRKLAYHLK